MRRFTKSSKPESNITRSKSVPTNANRNSNKNLSPASSNFRNSIIHHPCSEIQEPCDFYTNEIKIRPFISPQVKRTLLEQLKQLRILGIRVISTKSIKAQTNSNQFWEKWESFKIALSNEISSQLSSNRSALEKKLIILTDLSKLIKVDNLNKEITSLTKTLTNDLSQDTEQNFTMISTNLKRLQTHISSIDDRNNDSNVKLQFTSLVSQILTLMKTIKDVKLSSHLLYQQIEIDNETFQQLIPYDGPIFIPHQNITVEPEDQKPKRGKSLPKTVAKEKPIVRKYQHEIIKKEIEQVEDNEIEDNEIENDFEAQLEIVKAENARLKEQLQTMRETKFSRTIEVNNNKKNEEDEIDLLRSKISRVNQKIRSSAIVDRDTQSYSGLNNPLIQLRTEVRNLEIEKVGLNTTDDFYNNQIRSHQMDSDEYEKNLELQNKKDSLNKQLFELRLKCIDLNKTIQKANSGKLDVNDETLSVQKRFAQTNNANQQLKKQLDEVHGEFSVAQNKHNSIVSEKVRAELIESLKNSEASKQNNLQHQLDQYKKNYFDKKREVIDHNVNINTEFARSIRRSTDDNLSALRNNAKNANASLNSELQSVTENYNYMTERFNEASDKQEEEVEFHGQIYSLAEAEFQVGEILSKFNDLHNKSQQISVDEAEAEMKVLQKELKGLTERNDSLLHTISDIKTKSIQVHSRLQSLKLQYQIYQRKNEDPQYSLRNAYSEAIQTTSQENESLNAVLSNSLETLDTLHVERPF